MNVENKIKVDTAIENLDEREKSFFEMQYKQKKKSVGKLTLMYVNFLMYIFGIPFFYLKFKKYKIYEYISVLTFWLLVVLVLILTAIYNNIGISMFASGYPVLLILFLILFRINLIVVIVLCIKGAFSIEKKVEDYNYDTKLEILKNLYIGER